MNSKFAKISSRENISNSLFAKFSSRENKVLYSISCEPSEVTSHVHMHMHVVNIYGGLVFVL